MECRVHAYSAWNKRLDRFRRDGVGHRASGNNNSEAMAVLVYVIIYVVVLLRTLRLAHFLHFLKQEGNQENDVIHIP